MTGILWLQRNPLSLVFSAISPFSLLFVLFVISNGQYVQFALVGSLVMALVGYGLSLGQDISFYKTEYKIQDMFVASPVSSLTYMLGLALSTSIWITGTNSVGNFSGGICNLDRFYPYSTGDHFLNMGIYVIDGLFFILSYVAYAKCHPNHLFCKCSPGCPATRFL